jgi:hypothetical protein
MENIYLVPAIRPEDTIALVHTDVGIINGGVLRNVRESIFPSASVSR